MVANSTMYVDLQQVQHMIQHINNFTDGKSNALYGTISGQVNWHYKSYINELSAAVLRHHRGELEKHDSTQLRLHNGLISVIDDITCDPGHHGAAGEVPEGMHLIVHRANWGPLGDFRR